MSWNSTYRSWGEERDDVIKLFRIASLFILLIILYFALQSLFVFIVAKRVTGTITSTQLATRRCGRSTCYYRSAIISYSDPEGFSQSVALPLEDVKWSIIDLPQTNKQSVPKLSQLLSKGSSTQDQAFVGANVKLLYRDTNPISVVANSLFVLFRSCLLGLVFALGLGFLGYSFRTSVERRSRVLQKGPLAEALSDLNKLLNRTMLSLSSWRMFRLNILKFRQAAVIAAVFSMFAKLSKADGAISEAEIKVIEDFMRLEFKFDSNQRQIAISVFQQARDSQYTFEDYSRECELLYHNQPAMLGLVLSMLEELANADGHISNTERALIEKAKGIFLGADSASWKRARSYSREYSGHDANDTSEDNRASSSINAYIILGVSANATTHEIKRAYRKLALQNHPDMLIKQGLPESIRANATARFREIQEAYDQICQSRNVK